jgi:hypothetical protein
MANMFRNEFKIYSDVSPGNIPPMIQADVAARIGTWYIKQMGVTQLSGGTVVAWVVWEQPVGSAS